MVDDGWCALHNQPEETCPQCQDLTEPQDSRACRQLLPVIQLSSEEVVQEIGLEMAKVEVQQHADRLAGNAESEYNMNEYAEVRPRVRGLVHQILTDEGVLEHPGDVLAVIDSAEVGTAKANYLATQPMVELAEATLTRTEALTKKGALPLKNELEARTALNQARADLLNATQKLRNLGYTDSDLVQIEKKKDTSSLLKITSPIEGTVVARHAVLGEAIEANHTLFVVADTRQMWAWIDVYESEIDHVQVGQPVKFTITGTTKPVFPGEVDWVDTAVNTATRTIRVRAVLENPEGKLRAMQFGRAEIQIGEPRDMLMISREAVQNDGRADLVFLADEETPGKFLPQRVVVESIDEPGLVRVKWGLKSGQRIVTTGSFLLLSELLKDQLAE